MVTRSHAAAAALTCAMLAFCMVITSSGYAASASPAFAVRTTMKPTNVPAEGSGTLTAFITNVGESATNGEPLTVVDNVPQQLTITGVSQLSESPNEAEGACSHTATVVTCHYFGSLPGHSTAGLYVRIHVEAKPEATGQSLTNSVQVSGGEAATVTTPDTVAVGAPELQFGLDGPFEADLFDSSGAIDTQAGDHASSDTTGFVLNSVRRPLKPEVFEPVQELKDVSVQLPAGLVGDPQAAPTCPEYYIAPPSDGVQCPAGSVIGSAAVQTQFENWGVSGPVVGSSTVKPVFNVVPERGHAAEFAFIFENQEALLYANVVHTGAGYVVRVTATEIVPAAKLTGVKVTFFGDPAAQDATGTTPTAFFTTPQDCAGGPLTTTMYMDSRQNPGRTNPDGSPDLSDPAWVEEKSTSPAPTGCNKLQFDPELELTPTSKQTASPTGLNVDLRIPQNSTPTGLATPDLKDTTVTLPRGLDVSPSSAGGLQGCSNEQFAAESTSAAACPEASVIGSVTVHTPLLSELLTGRVFLGQPECNPCSEADARDGRMVRLFVEVANPQRGVDVKLPGTVSLDPVSGQLAATFANTPQLPFDHLEFHFKSGERAPLVTPESCGSYSTSADLAPWSAPSTPDALLNPSFSLTEGCGARGFAPTLSAGTVSNQGGAFAPFVASFSRADGEQGLGGVQVVTPPGMLALLASVPLCGQEQANAGTCPAASQIGHTSVVAGPGTEPLTVPQAGQPQAPVYLTGGYKGAPFGLSVVVPAVAGPFNLGTVVVRASIAVNPATAQAIITSDPLPRKLDGIPLDIRTVNVTIDRPGFTFNPTNCSEFAVGGTLSSTQSVLAGVSSRFQAAGCAGLSFKPRLSATVAAHSSKPAGASLDVKIAANQGPGGGEADIRGVKVDLPIQLPSRTSTLNKACLAAVFEANPANCPKESDVGTATATTPVLKSPVSGPAYLVSHGGAKFPDLEFVLQGEGVVLVVIGHTDIKKGITSSNFDTIPDAPIRSFEVKLPTGKFSILTSFLPESAHFSFCGQKLTMPTMITAQNGAVLKQTTKIGVTGCPKAKPAKKRQKTVKRKAKK